MKRTCSLCGDESPDVDHCYLRVLGASFYGVAGVVRWVNFECQCCDDCFEAGRAVSRTRLWLILFMSCFPLVFIAIGGIVYLLTNNQNVMMALLGIFAVSCLLLWIVMPPVIGMVTRRRIRALLGKRIDRTLRAAARISDWGFFKHVAMLEEIPKNERSVPLNFENAADVEEAEEGEHHF